MDATCLRRCWLTVKERSALVRSSVAMACHHHYSAHFLNPDRDAQIVALRCEDEFSCRLGIPAQRPVVRMATFDALTDLPNRWTLMERMERAMHASRQHTGICLPSC